MVMYAIRSPYVPKRDYVWMVPSTSALGDVIRQRRLEMGLTSYEVAERFHDYQKQHEPDPERRLKFNQGQVSSIERGETKSPDPRRLTILNVVLGFPPGHLESLTALRGAALRDHTNHCPPGSICIMPDSGTIYEAARDMQSLRHDDDLEAVAQAVRLWVRERQRRSEGEESDHTG